MNPKWTAHSSRSVSGACAALFAFGYETGPSGGGRADSSGPTGPVSHTLTGARVALWSLYGRPQADPTDLAGDHDASWFVGH